jgi:putative metalloprotease
MLVLCTLCLLSWPAATEAQIGSKILRRGNVEAVKKLAKAAVLTDDEVQQLSLQSVQYMDANNPVAEGGDVYSERLKKLVAGLDHEDGLDLNFAVYLVTDVNAFATPDGSIRVMAGLMNLMTDDELRSVIGHEVGHVKLKHSKKQYQKAYTVSAGRDAASANTGSFSGLAEGELGKFVEEVLNAEFSREDEAESDTYGFQFVVKHGYDYHAMQTAFLKLGALAGDEATRSLKATHPAPSERAEKAKKRADEEDIKRAAEQATDPATRAVPAEPATEPMPETTPEAPSE